MKKVITTFLILGMLCSAAFADKVKSLTGTTNSGQITNYKNGKVYLRLSNGRTVKTPISKVGMIEFSANKKFSSAEKALAAKDYQKASDLYEKALRTMRKSWQRKLVNVRMKYAQEKGGLIHKTVDAWLKLMKSDPSERNIAKVPDNLGNSKANWRSAYSKLARTYRRVNYKRNKEYALAILKLQRALAKKLNDRKKLKDVEANMAKVLGKKVPHDDGNNKAGDTGQTKVERPKAEVLNYKNWKLFEKQLEAGNGSSVMKTIATKWEKYKDYEYPKALLYLGWAQLVEGKARNDRKLVLAANVNFALIMAHYSGPNVTNDLPAFYLASQAEAYLKNKAAAKLLLEGLLVRYQNRKSNKWVKKAKADLPKYSK